MASKTLKILFVTAEVAPYSTVGGLSQVSYYLPKALKKAGVDIRVFSPKYGSIHNDLLATEMVLEGLKVPTGEKPGSENPTELICNVKSPKKIKADGPIIYFLENREYYEQRANVYGYTDDPIRFALLSRAAIEFVRNSDFKPDIIHINDWHTAYVSNYLKTTYKDDPELKNTATLLSVHNLFQGIFDFDHASEMDFDDGKGDLDSWFSERFVKQNGLKRGVIYSDFINTVSQTYSREIMTEQYGHRLHNLFKELRNKLSGVLNGLDYDSFNPKTDKIIKRNFTAASISSRDENKIDLQREFNLDVAPHKPLIGIVGRLDDQKGLELVTQTMDFLLEEYDMQLVIVGTGDSRYRDFFAELEKRYPGQVGTHLMFDSTLPRMIFAGADMLLMPSKYEPGGIVALEALRYGCVPVVRATGGLADSVIDYDPSRNVGTGFVFKNYSGMSLVVAVTRAMESFKNKSEWLKIVKRAMIQDFSWDKSAKKYMDLYRRAGEFHGLKSE